ncbi:2',3'-cyclic-nucleotide 3'-phosphodiesterase [Naematelia encephala]|uniref:2',3'-cyclic-nucleotide 3'-phosphodiesterase n=1 Tax=Naematelia encephala TaxID=71784 RepID=A0A1Y2AYY3_9TREE|nr:2',3'-cyclic-nucleotide 3'-phosphodiesterase [Naematelia encephala]
MSPSAESHALSGQLFHTMSAKGSPYFAGYALWLLPAGQGHETASRVIQILAGQESDTPGTFEPHVTLFGSLPAHSKPATIIPAVHRAIQSWGSGAGYHLSLRRQPAQPGELYYQSVLAPIIPQDSLLGLRKSCEKELRLDMDKPYFPHLSLFYGDLSQSRREELALEAERTGLIPDELSFEEIALVSVEGVVKDWKVVARVHL